jgi:hypothetical protein
MVLQACTACQKQPLDHNITFLPPDHESRAHVPQADRRHLQFALSLSCVTLSLSFYRKDTPRADWHLCTAWACLLEGLVRLVSFHLAIKETIGSGGFAKVKIAKHKITGEKVYVAKCSVSCT